MRVVVAGQGYVVRRLMEPSTRAADPHVVDDLHTDAVVLPTDHAAFDCGAVLEHAPYPPPRRELRRGQGLS